MCPGMYYSHNVGVYNVVDMAFKDRIDVGLMVSERN